MYNNNNITYAATSIFFHLFYFHCQICLNVLPLAPTEVA